MIKQPKNHIDISKAIALTLLAMPIAATAAPAGVEEIVVTARKREERLQSVPVAVSAFTADMLERRGIATLADLNSSVPNLGWQSPPSGGGGSSAFFIRGIGQFDFIATADQSVGLYVDGVYVARAVGALLSVVDLERIEILRGPQGTLFGRNTPAGAVQVFTQKPSFEDMEGWVEAGTGSHERIDVKASLNAPLAANAAIKLTAATLNQDGYGRSLVSGEEHNQQEDYYLRGQVRVEPSDAVRINIAADYTSRDGSFDSFKAIAIDDGDFLINVYNSMLIAQGFAPINSANFVAPGRYDTWKGTPSLDKSDIYSILGNVEWDLSDSLTVKSITGYRSLKNDTVQDFDGTPYPFVEQFVYTDSKQFSQELQLNGRFMDGRLNVVSGVFYFREHVEEFIPAFIFAGISRTGPGPFDFAFDPNVDGLPLPFPPFSFVNNLNTDIAIDQVTRSYAAFGELTYAVTDTVSFTAGLRYTKDEKDLVQSYTGRGPIAVDDDWSALTPRFSLSWQATDDVLAYVSASRGFRAGGFNGRESAALAPTSFDPEFVWSYEAGVKSDLLDRRLRLNLTGFYYDYKDRQGTVLRPDQTVGVGNIAAVEMYGAEVELIAVPVERLRVEGTLGLLHHEITKIDISGGIPGLTLDSNLENAPSVTASGALQYEFDLANSGSLTLRGDITYKSKHEFLLPNYPNEGQKGYAVVNARATWLSPNENWQVSVFGKNIFDKTYRIFGENTIGFGFGIVLAQYGRPAEWGIDVKYRF